MDTVEAIKNYQKKLDEAAGFQSEAYPSTTAVNVSKRNTKLVPILFLLVGVWIFYRYYYRPVVKGYGYK